MRVGYRPHPLQLCQPKQGKKVFTKSLKLLLMAIDRPSAILAINGCYLPILLKKLAMVSTAKKDALEIEIFTLSRGFRAQISRSFAQKMRFQH